MADNEGVPQERLVMFHMDQTIEPFDTIESLKLSIADIIGEGIQ